MAPSLGQLPSSIHDDDVPYEEDVLRNPFDVNSWLRYIEHKALAACTVRFQIYERGLRELPRRCVSHPTRAT